MSTSIIFRFNVNNVVGLGKRQFPKLQNQAVSGQAKAPFRLDGQSVGSNKTIRQRHTSQNLVSVPPCPTIPRVLERVKGKPVKANDKRTTTQDSTGKAQKAICTKTATRLPQYHLWFKSNFHRARRELPGASAQDVTRCLASRWRSMTQSQRDGWKSRAGASILED